VDKKITIDDLYQVRCIVTKENYDSFDAKDYNGRKYIIAKNAATKNYKVGTDSTFYATRQEEGLFFKKVILHPLTNREYEDIVVKNNMIRMPIESFA